MRIALVATVATVIALIAACTPEGKAGGACHKDTTCDDDLVCLNGLCEVVVGHRGEGEGEGAGEGEGQPPGEGEGEGQSDQQCPTNRRVCDSDRVCAGGFCDKEHDSADGVTGDGIDSANDPLGCCVLLVCQQDVDCDPGETCDFTRGICLPAGTCDPTSSSSSSCTGGACFWTDGTPQCASAPSPDACELTSAGAIGVEGAKLPLDALALRAELPLTTAGAPTFTFDDPNVDVDGTYNGSCAAEACAVVVTAHFGSITCSGTEIVLPANAAGSTRVVVVDAATRALLANVAVQASHAGALSTSTTDANGIATFAFAADFVSALPLDHDWHTVLAPRADVVIATRATIDAATVHGKKGTIDDTALHSVGDITTSVTGLALPSLVDSTLEEAIGDALPVHVQIQGVTDSDVLLFTSQFMTLGDQPIQDGWVALGDGRLVWSLAQSVALADIGPAISAVAGGDQPFSFLFGLGLAVPNADHAIAPVVVDSGARPGLTSDGHAPPLGAWPFSALALAPSTPAALSRTTQWPDRAPHKDGAVVALARVAGRGLVPLGAATKVDIVDETPPRQIVLGFAPPHDGLESAPTTLAFISVDNGTLTDVTQLGVGAIFTDLDDDGLADQFLAPVTGSFTAAAGAFASTNDPGADLYRVQLDADAGGRWFVWSSTPPSFDTAALTDGSLGTRADRARVEAFTFAAGVSSSFDPFAPGGDDIAHVDAHIARVSSEPCFTGSAVCSAP